MDREKYTLVLKNERKPLVVVYPNNKIKTISSKHIVIKKQLFRLVVSDIYDALIDKGYSDIYNKIESAKNLDVRNTEERLDYVRNLYYYPELDISIIDSESFLELKFGRFDTIKEVLETDSFFTHYDSKGILNYNEKDNIESILSKAGFKFTLKGFSEDSDKTFYIRYVNDNSKNIYIKNDSYFQEIKEYSKFKSSLSISSDFEL